MAAALVPDVALDYMNLSEIRSFLRTLDASADRARRAIEFANQAREQPRPYGPSQPRLSGEPTRLRRQARRAGVEDRT